MADRVIMFLANSKYFLDSVLKIGKSGLTISVNENEINSTANPEHIVTLSREFSALDSEEVIFYKQHGKFTIISGRNRIAEAKASPKFKGEHKGRLITTVALKRARIDEPVIEETPVKNYPSEFSNKPRFSSRTF